MNGLKTVYPDSQFENFNDWIKYIFDLNDKQRRGFVQDIKTPREREVSRMWNPDYIYPKKILTDDEA